MSSRMPRWFLSSVTLKWLCELKQARVTIRDVFDMLQGPAAHHICAKGSSQLGNIENTMRNHSCALHLSRNFGYFEEVACASCRAFFHLLDVGWTAESNIRVYFRYISTMFAGQPKHIMLVANHAVGSISFNRNIRHYTINIQNYIT